MVLSLEDLWIVHPGPHTYGVHERITVCALPDLASVARAVRGL